VARDGSVTLSTMAPAALLSRSVSPEAEMAKLVCIWVLVSTSRGSLPAAPAGGVEYPSERKGIMVRSEEVVELLWTWMARRLRPEVSASRKLATVKRSGAIPR